MDDWQLSAIRPFSLRWNLLGEVAQISCPTLWLRGGESKLVKQAEMERAVRLAQTHGEQARLVVVPQAGHILPLEQPSRANAEVLQILLETEEKSAPNGAQNGTKPE